MNTTFSQRIAAFLAIVIAIAVVTDNQQGRRQQVQDDAEAILLGLLNTADKLVCYAIYLVGYWPFVLVLTSFLPSIGAKAVVGLLPLVAIMTLAAEMRHPAVIPAVAAAIPNRRQVFQVLLGIGAAELALGLLFAFVPGWNDPGLTIMLWLVIATAIIGVLSNFGWAKTLAKVAAAIAVILTIFISSGGRDGILEREADKLAQELAANEPIMLSDCVTDPHLVENRLQKGGQAILPVGLGCHSKRIFVLGGHKINTSAAVEMRNMYQDGSDSGWWWYTPGMKVSTPQGKVAVGTWFRNDGSRTGGESVEIRIERYS